MKLPNFLVENEALQAHRDRKFTFKATIGELLDFFGEEKVKTVIEEKTADASYNPDYERTLDNVMGNWMMLVLFALAFALLSTLSLEMIDRRQAIGAAPLRCAPFLSGSREFLRRGKAGRSRGRPAFPSV